MGSWILVIPCAIGGARDMEVRLIGCHERRMCALAARPLAVPPLALPPRPSLARARAARAVVVRERARPLALRTAHLQPDAPRGNSGARGEPVPAGPTGGRGRLRRDGSRRSAGAPSRRRWPTLLRAERRARRSRRSARATARAAGRGPCPRPSSASRRGSPRAVARPPEKPTSGSAVPWITSVGAVMRRSSGVRLPEAMIAASWRPGPVGVVVAVVARADQLADLVEVAQWRRASRSREHAGHVLDERVALARGRAQEDRVDAQRGLARDAGCRCWT